MAKKSPKKKATPPRPVLIVQHAPHEHPAAIRRVLESQGIHTLWLHPYRGEHYPELGEIAGMISLGGPMGANDEAEHPWIKTECELLRRCVIEGLPTVGVCLGGQMMARALGGRVEKHTTSEVGWFPIELNEDGIVDPVVGAGGERPSVYHWHGDTFFLPPGATLLARSQACARQAYRVGERAYGFQFHPEADHQLVNEWLSVEGVEQEILEYQESFGAQTVQDARTQINHALKGERASLKITAAIGSLFREKAYHPELCEVYDRFESWATHRTRLLIEFQGPDRRALHLRGRIMTLLTIQAGEFVVFQEENTLLWPIRLDDVRKVTPLQPDER